MSRRKLIAVRVVAALCLLALGLLIGVLIAAPSVTDWRNACVADRVVPHAGTPGIAPGPASDPYADPRTISSTPRPASGPYPEHRRDASTTPPVITPVVRS